MLIKQKKSLLALLLLTLSLSTSLVVSTNIATANAGQDLLTFMGCDDDNKDGLDITDCVSSNNEGTVTSFVDFKGNLTTPNPEGYAAGLTQATDARTYIKNVVNFALGFLGLLAVLIVIYGGVMAVTSAGDSEKAGKGKKAIGYAVVGLLIVMSSFALVNTVLLAPGGSDRGAVGGGSLNNTSIRGVAGTQRFNYLAQRIDEVILRTYNSYQFHIKVMQQISNAKAQVLAYNQGNCYVPMSTCVQGLINVTNTQLSSLRANINDSSANAKFTTGMAAYVDKVSNALSAQASPIYTKINDEDCDSSNKFAEINPCTEDNISEIRDQVDAAKQAVAATFDDLTFLQNSYSEDINSSTVNTAEVYRIVSGLAADTIGKVYFNELIPNFITNTTVKLDNSYAEGESGSFNDEKTNMNTKILVAGSTLDGIDQTAIKSTLKNLAQIKSVLTNLKFVDTIISADIVQGNAPLIVNFSTIGSKDPSGFSITDEQIEWDIDGDGLFNEGDLSTSATSAGDNLFGTCNEKAGAVAGCIFNRAGTYRVTVKIKPKAEQLNPATNVYFDQEIAPGISYIDIKVNPPATKIDLKVSNQGGQEVKILEYDPNTGVQIEDRSRAYFVLADAKAGLVFDARKSKFSDGRTDIISDPSSKIRWNFGVPSEKNDTYQTPSEESLNITQAYPQVGSYLVRFEVTDKNGVIDRKVFTIVVSNVAPRLTNPPKQAKINEEKTFDGSNSTSDGGPLIFNWTITKIDTVKTAYQPVINWFGARANAAALGALTSSASLTSAGAAISAAKLPPIISIPPKVLTPSKRSENNDLYNCYMPEGKDDTLKCSFKKAGRYRVTLSLDDDGKLIDESSDVIVTSSAPTAGFKMTKITSAAPAVYKLDATKISYDDDEKNNDGMEYSWEINPSNCVLIGFADQTSEGELIRYSTDSKSAQTPCTKLKEYSASIGMPVVKFTKKDNYTINLAVRQFDEKELTSIPNEQTINVDNVLDIAWGDMKPSAILAVTNGGTGTDQLPDNINTQPVAPVTFVFTSSQAVSYDLDFGDGLNESGDMNPGEEKKIIHNYTKTGKFAAKLSVFDPDDIENSINRNIFIGDSESPVSIVTTKVNGNELSPIDITTEGGLVLSNVIVASRKDILVFDGEKSINTDGTGRRLKYSWSINDNEKQSTARQVSHQFKDVSRDGQPYPIKLTVTNDRDATQKSEDTVNILIVGEQPTLRSLTAVPQESDLTTPVNVKLTAIGAEDPDGQIVQYKWWYYDANLPASPENRLGLQITQSPSATLAIGTRGVEGEKKKYKFGVEITDNDNLIVGTDAQNEDQKLNIIAPQVEITNGPNKAPLAKFSVDRTSVNVGESVNFTSSSVDPDQGGSIREYRWDFGDGTRGENKSAVSHTYQKANVDGYRARLTVVDNNSSESTSDQVKIFVDAKAAKPVADFIPSQQSNGSKTVQFTNTSTSDQDAGATIKKYTWDFDVSTDSNGDGKKDNDSDSGSPSPSYQYPNYGTIRAKLTIEDSQGQIQSVTNFVIVKPAESPKPAGTTSDKNSGSGGSSSASKTVGANLFEASNKVEPGLLFASISAYVILTLISKKQKNKASSK
ncbi:PKD domain-containing protein [Candidatus Peregrinibacteria bacterium]|nr:PKD domain-containing protein [Candidatus Peregrinibacteria bacterium]